MRTCNCEQAQELRRQIGDLKTALRELKAGIEEHAICTVWFGPAETASDRIDSILAGTTQSDGGPKG